MKPETIVKRRKSQNTSMSTDVIYQLAVIGLRIMGSSDPVAVLDKLSNNEPPQHTPQAVATTVKERVILDCFSILPPVIPKSSAGLGRMI